MNIQVFIAFAVYFTILITIGIAASLKNRQSESDFIIGNRSLNFWLTALSAHAADMSAWLFMAFPAAIFIAGNPQIWIAIGLAAGMYFNWQLVAPRLRVMTEKTNSYTISTFFERRFNDKSGILRVLTAIMSIVFLTCYLSGGLIAMGLLFESLFGLDYYIGITFATVVVVIYTFFGGFVAVAWTDLFQGLFLLSMVILVPLTAFGKIGGIDSIVEIANAKNISLSLFNDYSWRSLSASLLLALGWGLGYYGQLHVLTKFMGIKDPKEMHKSKWLGMSWQVLALAASACVGLVGIAFFPDGLPNGELVFVDMVKQLFSPLFAGFILCAVLAANMSTMDSQILVCASVLTEDLYKKLAKHIPSSKKMLKMTRVSIVLVALVSLALASSKSSSISATVAYAWYGLGASFGPLVLMSLFSERANKYGAIAGILVGGILSGIWPTVSHYLTDYPLSPIIPGFFLGLATIYIVSLLTGSNPKPQETAAT